MTRRLALTLVAFAGTVALVPCSTHAQIRASERGGVSQTIDGTTIAIDYARPQARGRSELYGGEIPYGKIWTPGANWATTIEINKDITINGHALPEGKYSVWLQVGEGDWTAIFDPEPRRFHLMGPPPSDEQVRFAVSPQAAPHTEILTWSFHEVRPTGTTLRMAWGPRAVTFDIRVQPSRDLTVSADLASRYVGSYTLQLMGPFGDGQVSFDLVHENDRLVGHWENPPSPRLGEFWLISLGEGMFAAGELDDGELFDIVMDVIFEFSPYEGRATAFDLRVLGDALWGHGERR